MMTSGHRAESFLSRQVKGQTSHSLTWWFIPWASHNLQSHRELSVCCVCMVLCEVGLSAFSLGPSFSLVQVSSRTTGRPHLRVVPSGCLQNAAKVFLTPDSWVQAHSKHQVPALQQMVQLKNSRSELFWTTHPDERQKSSGKCVMFNLTTCGEHWSQR